MKSRYEMVAFAREALGIPDSASIEIAPLERRGSDRVYFRLNWGRGNSAILVRYRPTRPENTYYAVIGSFLLGINVPVPRMIRHDPARCLIVMEDLGCIDLWSLRNAPWEVRRSLYEKTLFAVQRLHSFPKQDFHPDRVPLMAPFDRDLYLWEQNYFKDHFFTAICRIELDPGVELELELELSALAGRLAAGVHCLVHRDLQSQNVMVRGGEPYLIDFQGMRFGTPFYDLGSLLCDPYVGFLEEEREELLWYYYRLSNSQLDWSMFQDGFWEASAQRLMQALGAYGFLGLTKGLSSYLEHVPAGIRNLNEASERATTLRCLRQVSAECLKRVEHCTCLSRLQPGTGS